MSSADFIQLQVVTLIVRPEMVHVDRDGGQYLGIVRRAVYLGDVMEYDVEVAGQLITGIGG